MARKQNKKNGYAKILDFWSPPEGAGDPVGCIATSFTFSPVFFEEECLGRFLRLESDATEDGPLYLIEREEKLAQVMCAAALVDQHHCKGLRSLRWDLLAARLPKNILHAKISLLYWEKLVRIIVGSANLTGDGYRRNQEIFGILDYTQHGDAPLLCLYEILEFLRQAGKYSQQIESPAPAFSRWQTFLDKVTNVTEEWGLPKEKNSRNKLWVKTVLHSPGGTSVLDMLKDTWPSQTPPTSALVISPFFDSPGAENLPAKELWKILRRRGDADIGFYVRAHEIDDDSSLFVHAPHSILKAQPVGRSSVQTKFYRVKDDNGRPLHLKGIWLEDERYALYMIGSSNFTSPGLGLIKNGNMEANLAYILDRKGNSKEYKKMREGFIVGSSIKINENLKWLQSIVEDEDSATDDALLHASFDSATYMWSEERGGQLLLTLSGKPPSGWMLINDDGNIFFAEKDFHQSLFPAELSLDWKLDRPPSGLWVKWDNLEGKAWWPVNISSTSSLPPPDELKNLPLEILIDILTSARPLHKALGTYLKKRKSGNNGGLISLIINPHDKVDTSQFLLQRTRRVSWALQGLRVRLERPVISEESLQWRMRGPVGVKALADALIREAHSEEEKAFLISELALEILRVHPHESLDCLPADRIRAEIRALASELGKLIPIDSLSDGNLKSYVRKVFERITCELSVS